MVSHKGKFLISNSTLKEKNFTEAVVFIIEHNQDGAFGLVVNQPEEKEFSSLMPELIQKTETHRIFSGGPVRPEVLFILYSSARHRYLGEEIIPDVFLGTTVDLLEILAVGNIPHHIYHGYAGWSPGQLDAEIEARTWILMPAQKEMIFHNHPEIVWREALFFNGGIYAYFARNIKDPFLN